MAVLITAVTWSVTALAGLRHMRGREVRVEGRASRTAYSFAAPTRHVNARGGAAALDAGARASMLAAMKRDALLLALLLQGVAACERPDAAPPTDAVPAERQPAADGAGEPVEPSELLDPAYPLEAHDPAWGYRQAADADLTGDGNLERVVLAARTETYRGRTLWDDGQPWQLYVEDADGSRTLIFSHYVQLGMLTMRVTRPEELEHQAIVLLEHLPDRMTLYEIDYAAPGAQTVRRIYRRGLDPRGEIASPRLP